jgi:hypothetical protein
MKSSDMDQQEVSDLSKITEETFNCRGYAVWKTNLDNYLNRSIGCIPDNLFSTTETEEDAVICEWSNDHAAYISHYYQNGDITVNEYCGTWDPEIQTNTYYAPDYTHPLSAGGITAWWEKDPNVTFYVNISGPTELEPAEADDFTAYQGGGCLEYYDDYKWWKRNDGGSFSAEQDKDKKKKKKKDGDIMAPPVGEWIYMYDWEGERTVTTSATYNFSLKCEVTDHWNAKATDIHSVSVGW